MWIFEITPDWIFHTLFYASLLAVLIGIFLKKVPFIQQYTSVLKYGGLFFLVCSIFLEGALYDYNVMQDRIEEVKKQVESYENQNKETNDKLAKLQEEFDKKNKEKQKVLKQYIKTEITRYDTKFLPGGQCEIPKEFIKAHNDAAERTK